MPGYIPSSVQEDYDQQLPESPNIPGSGPAEVANLQRMTPGVPSGGPQQPPGAFPWEGAATPLPAPPPQQSKLGLIADALHLFATQFREISQPRFYAGASAALREQYRKRDEDEAGRQDLAYVMALHQIGTPEAMTQLQKHTTQLRDPAAIKLAGEAVSDIKMRARLADVLDQGDASGKKMAAMIRAQVPVQLVPTLAKEMYNEDNPLNSVKLFDGGYLYWDRNAKKVQTVHDASIHASATDPANKRLQDAVSIAVSGKPLATLMEDAANGKDLSDGAYLKEVLKRLSDKNLTNDFDRMAYAYAQEKKIEGVRTYADLAEKSPAAAREVDKRIAAFRAEVSGATGLAAALSRNQAELEKNPIVEKAKAFYSVDSLRPGEVASPVSSSYKNLLKGIDENKIVAIQTDKQMETIKGMEDLEQFLLPEMKNLATQLPRDAGFATLVNRLSNPWKRYLGVPDQAVQVQGASGAFAIYLAKVFQGGASALSDADRKAAELLTVNDGDTAGSALIKIGIMQRMSGIRKMVAAGLNPRDMGVSAYTDKEIEKLAAQLRNEATTAPLGGSIRLKGAR